jgi:hypothetical protein
MDPRLRLHNAVIGLAHPLPPWPSPLSDAGYRLTRIEQDVSTSLRTVRVDLLFVSETSNALLAVEVKDGTVQDDQACGYDAMTPLDVIQGASVSVPDPTSATLDVMYAVDVSDAARARERVDQLGLSFGILSIGSSLRWEPDPLDPGLRAQFAAPIPVDLRAIPRLLPVDDESPASVLAPEIANELLSAILQGRESVTIDALIEASCWGWARFSRNSQGMLRRRVLEMLRQGQRQDLANLIVIEAAGRQTAATVRLTAPASEATTQAGSLREARALRARLSTFVARATGQAIPQTPGQLAFQMPADPDDEE